MATELNASYEYECLSHYSTQSLESIFQFKQFLCEFIKQTNFFCMNQQFHLAKIFSSKTEVQTRNQFSLCLTSFYTNHQNFSRELKKEIDKLSSDIIIPLDSFYNNLFQIYQTKLSSLNKSIQAIEKQKIHLNNVKLSYYKICSGIQEMENKIREYITDSAANKKKISQEKLNSKYEALMIKKASNESKLQLYLDEINKLNQLYDDYEIEYGKVIQSFSISRKNKGSFMKCIIEKWNKSMNNILLQGSIPMKMTSDVFNALDPSIDKKIFEEEFKDSLHCSFEKELFIPYDKNTEENNHLFEEEKNKTNYWGFFQFNNTFLHFIDKSKNKIHLENYIENKDKDKMTEIIQSFLNQLFSDTIIKSDDLITLLELNDKHNTFPFEFTSFYKNKSPHCFYDIKNIANLHHLSNIFNIILINITMSSNDEIDLTYSIVNLSEKTYCKSTYLNSLISKNVFFTIKEYWITLSERIIIKVTKQKINSFSKKDKFKAQFYDDYIIFDSNEDNTPTLSALGLDKQLPKYHQLTSQQKKIINENLNMDIHNVIKRFICHFGNFCIEYDDAIELIGIFCKKYHVNDELQKKFYMSYLDVSYLSIRKRMLNIKKDRLKNAHGLIKQSVLAINNNANNGNSVINIDDISIEQNQKEHQKNSNLNWFTIGVSYCFSFIEIKDYLSLMMLNKEISSKLKFRIYKYILLVNPLKLSLRCHISIWESLLQIKSIKAKYQYQTILNSITNNEVTSNKFNLIEIDAKRTFFKTNITKSREVISRILHCVIEAQTASGLIYCQGMNYIAAFIYEIVKEEEKSFYILLGLFSNTNYYTIYLNHLERLKIQFYICERLLYLFLPELHSYLSLNSFHVKLFGSPWLLTLFTNVYPFLLEDNTPNVLLRIWDMYLLKGWKGLLYSLLGLLKYHSNDIIKLNNEEIYLFMINNLGKSNIFHNNHYFIFIQYIDSIKISKSLLLSLEKEYKEEKRIQSKKLIKINNNIDSKNDENNINIILNT